MARSSKATLALLIYGIMMHYSAYCTPIGMTFPKMRLDNDVFDEDGNSLSDLAFGTDQIAIRSPPSLTDDLYTLYYPPEKRTERHADGLLDRALRDILVQLSARKDLHSLMAVRVGDNASEYISVPTCIIYEACLLDLLSISDIIRCNANEKNELKMIYY
uniref:Adenylate cyclase activating polypeptide 1b n=1 Tax=Sinocyclocheilus grahami TaxID=75366 RepID=A0A672Q0Y8_SINGR